VHDAAVILRLDATRRDPTKRLGEGVKGKLETREWTAFSKLSVQAMQPAESLLAVITGEGRTETEREKERRSEREVAVITKGYATFQKYHAHRPIAIHARMHERFGAAAARASENGREGRKRSRYARARACPCLASIYVTLHMHTRIHIVTHHTRTRICVSGRSKYTSYIHSHLLTTHTHTHTHTRISY